MAAWLAGWLDGWMDVQKHAGKQLGHNGRNVSRLVDSVCWHTYSAEAADV